MISRLMWAFFFMSLVVLFTSEFVKQSRAGLLHINVGLFLISMINSVLLKLKGKHITVTQRGFSHSNSSWLPGLYHTSSDFVPVWPHSDSRWHC